jgi:Peptidase family M54
LTRQSTAPHKESNRQSAMRTSDPLGSDTSSLADSRWHIRVLGALDRSLLGTAASDALPLPDCCDDEGRVPAIQVIRQQKTQDGWPVIIVTARDLHVQGFKRLFGLSDSRRRTAIVSTYHLQCEEPERVRKRLENVIAHERGHLQGLSHCTSPACLMNPARAAEDVDARPLAPCLLCARSSSDSIGSICSRPRAKLLFGALALVIACGVVLAGADAIARFLRPKKTPFSWQPKNGEAVIFYQTKPVACLRDTPAMAAAARAKLFSESLNNTFLQLDPPPFVVDSTATSWHAAIHTGKTLLIEFTAADSTEGDPQVFAQRWLEKMEPILRGKGTASESCQGCHNAQRLNEVQQWSRDHGKRKS